MAFHIQNLGKQFRRSQWVPGSVICITGAGSGIGRSIALEYASRQCTLILVSRGVEDLEMVAAECRAAGRGCVAEIFPIDVSEEAECARLMEHVAQAYGTLDILVLCAGIGAHQYLQTTTDLSIYRRLMDVNFFGYLYCTKYAMELLKAQHGQIVVVSSISGEMGLPMRSAYCASKFAVTGFFESLRTELKRENTVLMPSACDVDITIVCPPTVDTNLRRNALASVETEADRSEEGAVPGGKKHMSASTCAAYIVDAADHRIRKIYFPFKAYAAVYLRPFLPDAVDWLVGREAGATGEACRPAVASRGSGGGGGGGHGGYMDERGGADGARHDEVRGRSFGEKLRDWFGIDVARRPGPRSRL